MIWLVFFTVSVTVLGFTIIGAVHAASKENNRSKIFTPLNILFGGFFVSVLLGFIPINSVKVGETAFNGIKVLFFSLLNTFQVFTIDSDSDIILEYINESNTSAANAYSVFMAFLFSAAPVLTFGFLISFFMNISAYGRYLLNYRRDVYVFSELNEKSLVLAKDIRKNHKNSLIVFTDVFENNEENSYELSDSAKEIGAICFKKDLLAVNFKRHSKDKLLVFFEMGSNETENIKQSLKLISDYKDRENTRIFVFSSSVESELALTHTDKGKIKVRRINEVQSLINRVLYEQGHAMFENAVMTEKGEGYIPEPEERIPVNTIVVGMGRYGTEMIKALSWYGQMDGYRIYIDAFDCDPLAEDKFTMLCPELMSETYNGVYVPEESEYFIKIHSGMNADTMTFANEIMKLKKTAYVFVSLGSDEENIKAAVNLRMLFERIGAKPVIQAVVYNSDVTKALSEAANFKGQKYDIDFIGDVESSYSEDVIINSELEADALRRHLKWGAEEEFWKYEYNYRSSVASAIHMRARIACSIPGAGKEEEALTDEEKSIIAKLEHRRWNAYMRAEGYVFSGSTDKSSRNDLAKMHHDLVDFSSLSDEEKEKDVRVGTTG